ncbi:unnamed protein product [Angiostrongylus costaricensis]|uniref:Uncharacterized protein n=1 Tax=Angiostrongylus costaricensis TaxID=334426 RepID=A0A0R3PDK1_ANGCS|nr:unnamed protein product [Angiostrongylus costaricensis]
MRPNVEYLLMFSFLRVSLASYCGQATIPFTFQVLHSGLTVLGCAQPQCFGWNANGTRAIQNAQFYRIDGKEDGYVRQSDQVQRAKLSNSFMNPRVASCEEHYSMKSCVPGQWVGGIAPKGSGLQLRCCWYAPLLNSEDRGIAMTIQGQLVVGGEVMNDDDVDGFDYIADIKVAEIHKAKCVFQKTQTRMRTVQSGYGASVAAAPIQIPPNAENSCIDFYQTGTAPGYPQTQTVFTSPHNLQKITQTSYYLTNQPSNTVQAPIDTQFAQQNYVPFSHVAQPQPQPFGGLFNSALNPVMTPFQPQLVAVPAQPQSEVPFIMSTTPVSTFPPLTFPSLDKISRIDIPSVEDVENVIPPVQKAILTTVAKFFGVL